MTVAKAPSLANLDLIISLAEEAPDHGCELTECSREAVYRTTLRPLSLPGYALCPHGRRPVLMCLTDYDLLTAEFDGALTCRLCDAQGAVAPVKIASAEKIRATL